MFPLETGMFGWSSSRRFDPMRNLLIVLAAALLSSCAGGSRGSAAPRFAEQMDPAWNGILDSTVNLGVMLVARPGVYTRSGFEALASTDEVLRPVVPGLRWTSVDSSHPLLDNLRGWDLDSLSLLLLADSMVWKLPYPNYGEQLVLRQAKLSESTRFALRKVGAAMGLQMLVALRPGDVVPGPVAAPTTVKPKTPEQELAARAAAAGGAVPSAIGDSSKVVADAVWFGVFDLRSGTLWYSRDFQVSASRTSTLSAEGAWARDAWKQFANVLAELPERRSASAGSEPR